MPARKTVLIDLGRVWKSLGRAEESTAALLAASRGGEARAAESARELLSTRYPYVYEFQNALKLDPGNVDLRREFGYLLLRMKRGAGGRRTIPDHRRTGARRSPLSRPTGFPVPGPARRRRGPPPARSGPAGPR